MTAAWIVNPDSFEVTEMALFGGIVSLVFAALFTMQVNAIVPSVKNMPQTCKLANQIANGADAFLRAEYKLLSIFIVVVFILVGAFVAWPTAICFVVGAFLSALSGYGGMKIATKANIRTTIECDTKDGLNRGLQVAFKSGAVMALSVVGSGLVGLCVCYIVINSSIPLSRVTRNEDIWAHLSGFGFGASSIALFARVGGGIYTKAADVGADLVGKVEEALEEDSPDNPATIADNVGDNVGDVAGMGADLFESFVGSLIASATLGHQSGYGNAGVAFPFWVAGFGALCSIVGTFLVNASNPAPLTDDEKKGLDKQQIKAKENDMVLEGLLGSIRYAIYMSSFFVVLTTIVSVYITFGDTERGWNAFLCVIIGLVCGNLIGYFTEYATSYTYYPTQSIGHQTHTGPATVIIQGLGVGMLSTVPPVIFIAITILASYALMGVYGISIAAVGMLSTLGVTLATDAYGPVADNAGGLAEMAPDSEITDTCRETTDALDALGNTTAATGKGFAIGSAVLTALALMNAFAEATNLDRVNLLDPVVLPGILIGALLPFVFAALTMLSVGKAAAAVMVECRDQLNKKWQAQQKGEVCELDSQKCVEICTLASLQEMVIPGTIAVFAPIVVGTGLGAQGVAGLLAGGISSGFLLAVTMANAGGAWDNAKKWVEKGNLGEGKGKKSDAHKAAVVGDTVGDPFKDTSGPALNILIKLMSIVSLVFAPRLAPIDAPAYWWASLIVAAVVFIFCYSYHVYISKSGQLHDLEKIDKESAERRAGGAFVPPVTATKTTEEPKEEAEGEGVEMGSINIHI